MKWQKQSETVMLMLAEDVNHNMCLGKKDKSSERKQMLNLEIKSSFFALIIKKAFIY